MPPDSQQPASPSSAAKKDGHGHHHKERIGNYVVGAEIGRGSFATVYKGYRSVSALFWSACFEVQVSTQSRKEKGRRSSDDVLTIFRLPLLTLPIPPHRSLPALPALPSPRRSPPILVLPSSHSPSPSTPQKTRAPIAIKAVSRQKLTTKLLENLESEINILKVISHRNVVSLEDCFKNDTHIYLVMEFCSGSDLSIYIKNRGRLPTLDFLPRAGASENEKIFWPHPPTGGIDERITRCFLGQLSLALRFLRSQDLIHRDIKPQNLLLQPATATEIADGHPLGVPILKVADFGFARILPAAAMAETLCGSPLYMAPEILRYEKYDAKADLWSVGAVLFEMSVGKPPFRANNHVELLRKIEKGEDRIKFPDESSRASEEPTPPNPVSPDIKALIRGLLKRQPVQRMGFDEFFQCGVWDGYLTESTEEGSLSLEVSTDSSAANLAASDRVREMLASVDRSIDKVLPRALSQPISMEPASNSEVAATREEKSDPSSTVPMPLPQSIRQPVRRSEPKYYVSDDTPSTASRATEAPAEATQPATPTQSPHSTPAASAAASSRPIQTPAQRRLSVREKEPGSLEETQPITPTSLNVPPPPSRGPRPSRGVGEGSPLAATPPMTIARDDETTGKDDSALEASDSVVGREYVVVEKRTVEINALADELDQASKRPTALVRRQSSRTSVVSRPVSAFNPATSAPAPQQSAIVSLSYSPPFSLSTTPPFAIPPTARQSSATHISQPPSIPQSLNIFPPTTISYPQDPGNRFGSSPSSLQTGALARAITNTAIRLIGTGATTAATAIAKAAAKRRPSIFRTGEIDPVEDGLVRSVEEVARKAFVLFELADSRLVAWQALARPPPGVGAGSSPPFGQNSPRRKSSSSSFNSEVMVLRQQEAVAGEAVVLYCKALAFIMQGTNRIQRYWERVEKNAGYETSSELNEMVQWLRARFNDCFEKAEWAKARCADELPFVDRLVHGKARETSRQAAIAEIQGDYVSAEGGYESSLWLLQALLDDIMYDGGHIREEDRIGVEKVIAPIKVRLDALKRKVERAARGSPGSTVKG